MNSCYPLLINGALVETDDTQKVVNPSNNQVIAEACVAGEKETEQAIDAARLVFDSGVWPLMSLDQRGAYIAKIASGILDNSLELARIETLNTGKPLKETTFMDIPSSAETFRFFAENLKTFLRGEHVTISSQIAHASSSLQREPVGVVALIVPWNYPLLIASWKMAQALAAGNTVVLKPSGLTPLSALTLAKIIKDAGLPPGVVNIISGPGSTVGKALCIDARVDMVSFTGSNEVGRQIMEYAGRNVKKIVIELGGKSASIILSDADLESAVNGSLCSIFLNQGQMCTAMSRILVQDGIYDAFVGNFITKARRIQLGPGEDFQTQMGPLISQGQRTKVIGYVEKAKKEGARLLCGGKIPDNPALKDGFFFEPTVMAGVTPQMSVFQEEIFGPVVCISKFSSLDQAIALANASEYGLAACIWSKDHKRAADLAGRINAGTVWINTYGMFFNETPYGGFKRSGFGKELGREGFLEYTRLKNVISDTSDSKPLVSYWYGF